MSTSPAPACVSIRRVNRTFGTHTVLDHVDIEIEPGEVVARRRSGSSYRWADRDRRERGSRDRPALCGRLPGTSAVAVAISGGQRRVRAAPRAPRGRKVLRQFSTGSMSSGSAIITRGKCPVVWRNAQASRVPLPGDPASCCSTSRWRPWRAGRTSAGTLRDPFQAGQVRVAPWSVPRARWCR